MLFFKRAVLGRWNLISEDRAVGGTNERPDLVLEKENSILLVDITCKFENGLDAFSEARKIKETKYDELGNKLSVDGKSAKVEAIIVGSLGTWDSENDRVVKRLCAEKYEKIMRKIIIIETLHILGASIMNTLIIFPRIRKPTPIIHFCRCYGATATCFVF